ncbi:MAG: hypothetical protein P4L33_07620 [Capsulimonadaceae bacterium]|nr:hypothetical protein [Capsulimonadaceae bacterium]
MASTSWYDDDEDRFEEGRSLTNKQAVQMFVNTKSDLGEIGTKTVEDYTGKLSMVMSICEDNLGIPKYHWQMMNCKIMDRLVIWMRQQPKEDNNGVPTNKRRFSDYTILRYVVVTRMMYTWMFQKTLIEHNKLEKYKNPEVAEQTGVGGGETATREEFDGLIKGLWEYYESSLCLNGMKSRKRGQKERSLHAYRNQAMILFMACTMLRPVTVCALRLSQLNVREDGTAWLEVEVVQNKNRTKHRVEIDKETVGAYKAYQRLRNLQRFPSGDQGWLFAKETESKRGIQQIHSGRWTRNFGRILEFAQSKGYIAPDRHLTPYSLKRYAYQENFEFSVQAAMMQANHKSGLGIVKHYVRDKSRAEIERQAKVQAEAQRRVALNQSAVTAISSVRL